MRVRDLPGGDGKQILPIDRARCRDLPEIFAVADQATRWRLAWMALSSPFLVHNEPQCSPAPKRSFANATAMTASIHKAASRSAGLSVNWYKLSKSVLAHKCSRSEVFNLRLIRGEIRLVCPDNCSVPQDTQ
jgi:hypothetical protein